MATTPAPTWTRAVVSTQFDFDLFMDQFGAGVPGLACAGVDDDCHSRGDDDDGDGVAFGSDTCRDWNPAGYQAGGCP